MTSEYVMVPREPTNEIASAIAKFVQARAIPSAIEGVNSDRDEIYFDNGMARELYRAMLSAAPASPGGEAVAWAWSLRNAEGKQVIGGLTALPDVAARHKAEGAIVVPLYPHPPAGEVERLREALREIADHNNAFLTDGSQATRTCLDWMVNRARAALGDAPQ